MQDIKNKIEAVLFISGKYMDVEEIANFCSIGSVGIVRDAIKVLKEEYDKKDSGLAIYEENGSYKLNLRKGYNHLSTNLASGCELDPPTQATLAVIAYKQPAFQAEIIKIRGNKAYDHIKSLREQEFITSEKKGQHGFGYDPIFFYPPLNRTFAEFLPDEKNEVSHRGKVLGKLKIFLSRYLGLDGMASA